ncbi:MAG: 30S ribosomal protein S12 methylthiotransferase RimO [bacterium]
MNRIHLISLGCPKNLVDSERMWGLLQENGYQLVNQATEADLIIINTCGFIRPAKEESIEVVLKAAQAKETGRCKGLIMAGCLAERYREELPREIPEVDLFLRLKDVPQIVKYCDLLLGKRRPIKQSARRSLLTLPHTAYLRIADGCNNHCSYCAIPIIRGPCQSRNMESIIEEAKDLASSGVKELNLIAQDTTNYGVDLYGRQRLEELIRSLSEIEKIRWIRLLYTHPAHILPSLIKSWPDVPKLCPYLDMPIQHISNPILKLMNRRVRKEDIVSLIERLREAVPDLTLRTSIIVGFPGESEVHFEELLDFVAQARFDRLGAFIYSREEGTSAARLPDQVPEEVKSERLDRLMQLQQQISRQRNEALIGQEIEVLIDQKVEGRYIGRSPADAPEIDGRVIITPSEPANSPQDPQWVETQAARALRHIQVGEFCRVRITGATEYDLLGEI